MARKSKPETQEAAASEAANVKDQISKADAPLTEAEKANPVQTAVAKRLRAARKRLGKVAALAAAEKEGKELNTDQVPSRHHCSIQWIACCASLIMRCKHVHSSRSNADPHARPFGTRAKHMKAPKRACQLDSKHRPGGDRSVASWHSIASHSCLLCMGVEVHLGGPPKVLQKCASNASNGRRHLRLPSPQQCS